MTHEDRENFRAVAAMILLHKIVEEGDYGDLTVQIMAAVKGATQLVRLLEETQPRAH